MDAQHSALSPVGPDAGAIATLSWIMFGGATLIFLGVLGLTIYAHRGGAALRRRLGSRGFVMLGGVVFPTITLTALLVYGLMLTAMRVTAPAEDALRIDVTGERWWWRVRYPASANGAELSTANEIRIPIGRPVEIRLTSADVIHSFWVPNLAGKVDMIPGVVTRLRLQADQAGTYRGQCAEYCGGPHALMAFHVVALEPAQFEAWLVAQRLPAAAAPSLNRGETLFLSTGCNGCHAIRGTVAAGTIGPDLTHVGARLSIGAGRLPGNAESFARWIRDNQHLKPNNLMPPFGILPDGDLAALAGYLASLR